MENNTYIGLSRQMVLQTQMTLAANNIANVNTPGYREQNLLFREYVNDPTGETYRYSQVYGSGQFENTKPGATEVTGNPLDIALEGPGFLSVQTPNGIRYTRAGNLTRNADGQITTADGKPVLGAGGPVTIPDDATEIVISTDGTISTQDGSIGKLQVTEFANEQSLVIEGNGLYNAPQAGTPAANTKVRQGLLERANVQAVVEMTRMIEILRDYQSIQRMAQSEHDLQRSTIQRLTRSGN